MRVRLVVAVLALFLISIHGEKVCNLERRCGPSSCTKQKSGRLVCTADYRCRQVCICKENGKEDSTHTYEYCQYTKEFIQCKSEGGILYQVCGPSKCDGPKDGLRWCSRDNVCKQQCLKGNFEKDRKYSYKPIE
eukprot:TRINITY_DN3970_c0_g1_i5.p1 TRINITY_DN3970_c0_g1~~TRINITY_DN3970_c0_g1_i5.p1  ORF type:complete len:134 (-),score=10.77 TRINITY_DN3970_c0_g1_i5:150-551(-)